MLGFEIQINDRKSIIAASDRRMGILMSCNGFAQDGISVFGTNSFFQDLSWYSNGLEEGDRIKIKVVEVDEASPLSGPVKDMDRAMMQEIYHNLKTELMERGLI